MYLHIDRINCPSEKAQIWDDNSAKILTQFDYDECAIFHIELNAESTYLLLYPLQGHNWTEDIFSKEDKSLIFSCIRRLIRIP